MSSRTGFTYFSPCHETVLPLAGSSSSNENLFGQRVKAWERSPPPKVNSTVRRTLQDRPSWPAASSIHFSLGPPHAARPKAAHSTMTKMASFDVRIMGDIVHGDRRCYDRYSPQ